MVVLEKPRRAAPQPTEKHASETRPYEFPAAIVLSVEAFDAFMADDEPVTPEQIAAFIR